MAGFDLRSKFFVGCGFSHDIKKFFVFHAKESGKYTHCKSLHFSRSLPIIITMKIWFRIGPDQGNEQDGPQPPERYSSADASVRFLDRFTLLALTKEGRICEGSRFSGVWLPRSTLSSVSPPTKNPADHSLPRGAVSHLINGLRQGTASAVPHSAQDSGVSTPEACEVNRPTVNQAGSGHSPLAIRHFSRISNRNWPKDRSYRKKTGKPCLTGARIAHSDLRLLHPGWFSGTRFSRDFASLYPASPNEGRELSRRGMLSRDPLFESRTLQQDVRFSSSSTRFWSKSRSYRKQTIKPRLPGSRNAQCVTRFLHDSRTLFVPAVAGATSACASVLEDFRRSGRVLSLPGRQPRMGYIERIQTDLTAAMKQKDELRLSVLRMMKSALKNKEIEKVRPLDDLESLQVLQTLVKQRHESVEQFTKGGRNDLAEKEAKEIKIIETYLPAAPSDEEVHRAVEAAIAEAGADSLKQMGAVIKAARARLEGKSVDGKALSDRVRDRLTEKSAGKP